MAGKYVKVCTKCNESKPHTDFYKSGERNGKQRTKSYCKVCAIKINKHYVEQNPYNWITKRYNVSLEIAKDLYMRSMKTCDICGVEWNGTKERLCIDHDHATGKVRGVLCKHCNHILGHSRDSVTILKSAVEYLERN